MKIFLSCGCELEEFTNLLLKNEQFTVFNTFLKGSSMSIIEEINNNFLFDFDPDILLISLNQVIKLDFTMFQFSLEDKELFDFNRLNFIIQKIKEKLKNTKIIILSPLNYMYNTSFFGIETDVFTSITPSELLYTQHLSLLKICRENKCYYYDINQILNNIPSNKIFVNYENYTQGHISKDAQTELYSYFLNFLDIIDIKLKQRIKLVCIDVDNTVIWGGLLRETEINDIKVCKGRFNFLNLLVPMGIQIVFVSKNDEIEINKFKKIMNSVCYSSSLDKYVLKYIFNWEPKSINIKNISKITNISEENIAFFDDNEFEREEVKKNTKCHVYTDKDMENLDVINNYLFKPLNITVKSHKRIDMLKENILRQNDENNNSVNYENFFDYLRSLNMKIKIKYSTIDENERINELINRTNRQNLSNTQLNNNVINDMIKKKLSISAYLEDKFGNYGLIGVIMFKNDDKDILIIEQITFSCRAMGKDIEFNIIKYLIKNIFKTKKITIPVKINEKNISFFNKVKVLFEVKNNELIFQENHESLSIDSFVNIIWNED
jgi:FkbH-like protein